MVLLLTHTVLCVLDSAHFSNLTSAEVTCSTAPSVLSLHCSIPSSVASLDLLAAVFEAPMLYAFHIATPVSVAPPSASTIALTIISHNVHSLRPGSLPHATSASSCVVSSCQTLSCLSTIAFPSLRQTFCIRVTLFSLFSSLLLLMLGTMISDPSPFCHPSHLWCCKLPAQCILPLVSFHAASSMATNSAEPDRATASQCLDSRSVPSFAGSCSRAVVLGPLALLGVETPNSHASPFCSR